MFDVVESIAGRICRVGTKDAKRLGVSVENAQKILLSAVTIAVANPDLKGEELEAFFAEHIKELAETEKYAAEYLKAREDVVLKKQKRNLNSLRRSYDKAVKAGVDPVLVLRADLGLSEEDAKAKIAFLKKQDDEADAPAQDTLDQAVSETNVSIPAQNTGGADLDDDDDDEAEQELLRRSPGPGPELFAGAVSDNPFENRN